MSVNTSPRFERVFGQTQTAYQTVPTLSMKMIRSVVNGCKMKAAVPLIPVPWKTGTRSLQTGISGRLSGANWSLNNLPVIPSGTPGTPPDMDFLLQGIFGQAPTGAAYSFADATYAPFCLARFMHGQSGVTNQFAYGCLVNEASFQLNGDVFTMGASGPCYWVLDSENFSNEDTAGKGGLSAFPTEPSNPTVVGTIQQGFFGIATFDSNTMDLTTTPLIAGGIRIRTGNYYTNDAFGSGRPASLLGGERQVSINASFIDNDSAALNNLKTKAKAKTPINVTIQVGTTTGSITTFTIKGVQLEIPDYSDDNARVVTAFGESIAHASTLTAVDEFALAFS